MSLNNDEFVTGLRNHEPAAAKHLSECYLPTVWRFVYFRVDGDRHLAEDIVSESVLALVAAVNEGSKIEYPSAWLRTVASRRIQDHFRAAARVAHLLQEASGMMATEVTATPASVHDQKLKRAEVRHVLDQMTEQHRLALEWKYIDSLSVREIADRFDVTEKSVESILFRARKTFRERLSNNSMDHFTPANSDLIDDEEPTPRPIEMMRTPS